MNTGALSPDIQNLSTKEEMLGNLEAVLNTKCGAARAQKFAAVIVEDGCFDSSQAIADLTIEALDKLGIPIGQQAVVMRAVFDGIIPSAMPSPAPVLASPASAVFQGAPAEAAPREREFKREWPTALDSSGLPSAADLQQFGLAARAHMRDCGKDTLATEFWRRFTNVSDPISGGYAHADADDAWLSRMLLSAGKFGIPAPVSRIMSVHIQNDQGMRATHALTRRVFIRTEDAATQLKESVRNPKLLTEASKVAGVLTEWDAKRTEAHARGFPMDQHDLRQALYRMVSKIEAFKATVESLKRSVPGGHPSVEEIRTALGEVAADCERSQKQPASKSNKAKAARKKKSKKAKAVAAQAAAPSNNTLTQSEMFSAGEVKEMVKAMASEVRKSQKSNDACREWTAKGKCSWGERCRFVHGESGLSIVDANRFAVLADTSDGAAAAAGNSRGKRSKFMALMAEMYDGGHPVADIIRASLLFVQRLGFKRVPTHRPKKIRARTQSDELGSTVVVDVAAGAAKSARKPRSKLKRFRRSRQMKDLPVADTGADAHFVGTNNAAEATNTREIDAIPVDTAGGTVHVNTEADLGELMQGAFVLPTSEESLCSVGEVCETHQLGFNVAPGNESACFYNADGTVHLALLKDGKRFRVPLANPDASAKAMGLSVPSWYREHARRGHPYRSDCEHCVRGVLRERRSEKIGKRVADPTNPGYTMSADFTGKGDPDVDGHPIALVACVHGYTDEPTTAEAAFGFVALLRHRTSKEVAAALDDFDAELQRLGKDKNRAIVRFHTDVDKSFLSEVQKLAVRKGWRQTDTGGYKSAANGIVERRIGMLRQKLRTMLVATTGGVNATYIQALWGHAMVRANFYINVNDWSDRPSPWEQLTGAPYVWTKEDHAFGEYCTWGVPKENRDSPHHQVAEQGVWVRPCPNSAHCSVVVPIRWNAKRDSWDLMPTIVATRVKVHTGVMPLRMKQGEIKGDFSIETFVDTVFDPLLASQQQLEQDTTALMSMQQQQQRQQQKTDGCEASRTTPEEPAYDDASDGADSGDEWEVEQILNKKESSGQILYLLKWKGFSRKYNSWEPASSLRCNKLIKEYERECKQAKSSFMHRKANLPKLRIACMAAALSAPEMPAQQVQSEGSADQRRDDLMAVTELMAKQGLTGDPEEWLPGYRREVDSVTQRRLQVLTKEEQKVAWRDNLVVRLRMILEGKRDGRKKGRLILQGFREPWSWERGKPTDSPVAYMTTIRMMLFMAGLSSAIPSELRHVVSSRDISVAFLQADEFDKDDAPRYVSYKAWKKAATEVYRLKGGLYGQRSASRRFYETISRWLNEQGYHQSSNEPCLFKHEDGSLIALYVDDILLRATMEQSMKFHTALGRRFDCRGGPSYLTPQTPLEFLGFTASMEERDDGTHVFLDQQEALEKFLSEMQADNFRLQDCPMPSLAKLFSDPTLMDELQSRLYRHGVGFLNFMSKTSRFDISHTVSMLGTQMHKPTVGAGKALRHLIGYLSSTVEFRIGGKCADQNIFDFYSDSDHASTKPHCTRSHSGAMLLLNGVPVAWLSKRQPVTAVSPAEAEIYALRDAAIAAKLMQWVAEDMHIDVKWPLAIKVDSTQARSFQHSNYPNSKLRGCFDIRNSSIQEMRDKKIITTEKIPRDLNLADLLTHCLSRCKFREQVGRAQNFQRYNCKGACLHKSIFRLQLC